VSYAFSAPLIWLEIDFSLGGKSTSSAKKLEAVNAGRSYNFGVTTEIQCVKKITVLN
jgi:hypothetical protein